MSSADGADRLVADWQNRLTDNWQATVAAVTAAAKSAGRRPESVRIVGVSKYVGPATTRALAASGCLDLGEARPQQLTDKANTLSDLQEIRWHLIGSLQRNKVRRVVRVANTIHSIDSTELLSQIDRIVGEEAARVVGLLEVNLSGDASKHGFSPAGLPAIGERLAELRHLKIVGLMGMSGIDANGETAKRQFAMLRECAADLAQRCGIPLPELSMGMSGDFAEAIAEGATLVRIGSKLFEGLFRDERA